MSLTQDEQNFIEAQYNEMKLTKTSQQQGLVNQTQQAMMQDEQNVGMVKEQLSLSEELNMIENLLRGNILKANAQGILEWTPPKDKDMIILSEHGVHLIMNTISFYLNKNTLLSNYDEETILTKMEDFGIDLSDTIFMEYERAFEYPTFEDCKKVFEERMNKKTELRAFALDLVGKKVNKEEIKKEFIAEIEDVIGKELEKIKEQIIKNKLKRFSIIIREVQDAIHSTYLRAYKGMERSSLRKHMHITETKGGMMPTQQPSKLNPLNWGSGGMKR